MKLIEMEGKRLKRSIPVILMGVTALFIFIGAVAFCAIQYWTHTKDHPLVKIGLVSQSETELGYALQIAESFDASNNYFEFIVSSDEESALQDLEAGQLHSVMIMPENIIESILNGTNYHVKIYFGNSSNTADLLLKEFSYAGASILSSAQAGIYAIADLYISYELNDYLEQAFSQIDQMNLNQALVSDELFDIISLSPTGTVSLTNFYVTAGFLVMIALLGLTFSEYLVPCKVSFLKPLKRLHISQKQVIFVRFGYVMITYFVLSYLLCIIPVILLTGGFHIKIVLSFPYFIFCFLLALIHSVLLIIIFNYNKKTGVAIIQYFMIILILALTSGFIIPPAFLGDKMRAFILHHPYHYLQLFMFEFTRWK